MTLENARVLYKHRLSINKNVDDILARFPELGEKKPEEKPEVKEKVADSNSFKKKKEK